MKTIMWIARDEEAVRCRLFVHKPKRYEQLGIWIDGKEFANEFGLLLDSDMYTDVKWEDEPLEVEIVPKGTKIDYLGIEAKLPFAEEILEERKKEN